MTALSAAPARRRAAFVALPALIAGLLAPVALAAPAGAATLSNGITTISTGFAIDGNKTPTNDTPDTFDWDDFLDVDDLTTVGSTGTYTFTPTGPYTTADGYSSTGIVDGTFGWDNGTLAANCSKPDATAFPGSVKPDDNPWPAGSANVLPKANGCSFGNAHEIITDDDGLEHHILYQYWTRLEGNGDMTTYQSLEGGSAGRCDDYLVEFNYDPSTGTSVRVLEWVADGGDCSAGAEGEWSAISPNFPYQAAVGTRIEGPGLPAEVETFGEMAIDLTLAGLFDEDSCTAFQTTGYITRTGNSNTAELGDLVGGDDPLTLSNCGTISVTKAGSPADAVDATEFGYVITNGGDAVHDDALTGTDGTDDLVDSGDDPVVDYDSIEGEIGFGETHTWGPVYSGDYAIEEIIPAGAPWALWSLECTVDGDSYTIVDDGEPVEDAVIPVIVGQDTACVLTNATSAVTVTKIVEGAEDQSFAFDLDGDLTDSEIDLVGTLAGTTSDPVAYAPGTSVTITELLGDLDWELTDVTCSDDTTGSDGSVTVTTTAGSTIDCVFTNLQFGTIDVEKSAVGGDGTFSFDLQPLDGAGEPLGDPITESTTTSGGTGTASFGAFPAGSRFSISETDPGDEWVPGDLACTVVETGAELDESDFTVSPGDTISCAITNTATGTIIVVKNVTGTDDTFAFTGDWLTPDDFAITTVAGTGTSTFDDVVAGSYTLTEVLGDGYDGVGLSCLESVTGDSSVAVPTLTASLELQPGETITCTYTNAEWGGLVVDKVTVPEGSEQSFEFEWAPVGEAADDFALADGSDAFSTGPIAPGEYVVTEKGGVEGWLLTGIVCTDAADNDSDPVVDGASATVYVGLGETVTCTFTNAQRGPLEFDKSVSSGPTNNGDGTWTIEYTLTVTSKSNVPEDYDLEDELDFGDGIVPTSASVVSSDGVDLEDDWNGLDATLVADDATIPALGTHTYTVTVTAEIASEMDLDARDCTVLDGEGTGFLNAGSIEFWNGSDSDDACAPLPVTDIRIVKDAPFSVDFEPEVGPTDFAYTIVVTNLGPDTAREVEVEDQIPAGLEVLSATATAGVCNVVGNLVTCSLGDLAVNASRTVTITVRMPVDYPLVDGDESFTITNVATTSTTTPETDLTNNEDDAPTTVLVTLPFPPEDPEDPELPTLAITGATFGLSLQLALMLLGGGATAVALAVRRRPSGRHSV